MTAILGLHFGGVSYLAADSRFCAGNPIPTKAEKIVRAGRWAIGASGYARTSNVLSENVRLLATIEDIARLCRELRRLLLDDGWQKKNEDGPSTLGDMALIVADESAVWFVAADFSYLVLEDARPWGTGSGGTYAEGSCTALLSVGWAPEAAMREAIRIAARYDPGTDDRIEVARMGADLQEIKDAELRRRFARNPDDIVQSQVCAKCRTLIREGGLITGCACHSADLCPPSPAIT